MTHSRTLLVVLCLATSVGCSSVRPLAQHGVDLLENTERSYTVRTAAVVGSMLGVIVALPVSVLLIPSYPFDGAWGWGVREPTKTEGTSAEGDYTLALAGVPIEYGLYAAAAGAIGEVDDGGQLAVANAGSHMGAGLFENPSTPRTSGQFAPHLFEVLASCDQDLEVVGAQ